MTLPVLQPQVGKIALVKKEEAEAEDVADVGCLFSITLGDRDYLLKVRTAGTLPSGRVLICDPLRRRRPTLTLRRNGSTR